MMIGWRDLRGKCKVCGKRADFSVELTCDDLPKGYFREGTREEMYCLEHVPDEAHESKRLMTEEAMKPFGT